MDKEEIIRRLKKISEHAVHVTGESPFIISLDDGIALNEAVRLLKKQEPKKPRRDTVGEFVCPYEGCHHRLSLMLKQNYCDVCGQAVMWNEK